MSLLRCIFAEDGGRPYFLSQKNDNAFKKLNSMYQDKSNPLLLSLKTVAIKIDVSTRTVVRMHNEGKIRLYRMGGKLFAKKDELEEDLEKILEPLSPK